MSWSEGGSQNEEMTCLLKRRLEEFERTKNYCAGSRSREGAFRAKTSGGFAQPVQLGKGQPSCKNKQTVMRGRWSNSWAAWMFSSIEGSGTNTARRLISIGERRK